jgi:hypothetical protein
MEIEKLAIRAGGTAHIGPDVSWSADLGRYLFGPASRRVRAAPLMAEIRRLGGFVVPADVMRVTGLDRAHAEELLCKLVARTGGDVGVVGAAVVYRFPRLVGGRRLPAPVWEQTRLPDEVTGNDHLTDVIILAINLLVLALTGSLTLLGLSGSAWLPALSLLPFLLALFALSLPLGRLLGRRGHLAEVAAENGRRALLRVVLERPAGTTLSAHALSHVWATAARRAVTPARLLEEVRALGGELDLDDEARPQFRFPDLDHESVALRQLRA